MAAMTDAEKLTMLESMLEISSTDTAEVARLTVYLSVALKEILAWRYSYHADYATIVDLPIEYEMTQIHAVIAGYAVSGAENQTAHGENGISRSFKYSDMIDYIHAHVIPFCGV